MRKRERADADDDARWELEEAGGRTPRWVSVLGILIAVGVGVLFVVLHLTGVFGPGVH